MSKRNEIEMILEKAFTDMKKRYRDILDVSYRLREYKTNLDKLVYYIELRGQLIEQINSIQATIQPVFSTLQEQTDISMSDIYDNNPDIFSLKEDIKNLIGAVSEIDDEITEYIAEAQAALRAELENINRTKKVQNAYKNANSDSRKGRLIDNRK
ncbi:MAG: hypothetical protein ACOCWO_04555 [Candidatus Muiribacteriaceae bacterium]